MPLTEGAELSGRRSVFKQPQAVRPQVQLRAAGEISAVVLPARQHRGREHRAPRSGRFPRKAPADELLRAPQQGQCEAPARSGSRDPAAQGEVLSHRLPGRELHQLDAIRFLCEGRNRCFWKRYTLGSLQAQTPGLGDPVGGARKGGPRGPGAGRDHAELTESADEPARLQRAPRAAEEAHRLGLGLTDVHQLPRQPAQAPLGPVAAQRGLQATALRPRAVGAAIQPQRAPALHERHAGLQVRPEGLLRDRCPGKRGLSLGSQLPEISAPLAEGRASPGPPRTAVRKEPRSPTARLGLGFGAALRVRTSSRLALCHGVGPGPQGSEEVVGVWGRGERSGELGSGVRTARLGGGDC